jgi:hypothetical protein
MFLNIDLLTGARNGEVGSGDVEVDVTVQLRLSFCAYGTWKGTMQDLSAEERLLIEQLISDGLPINVAIAEAHKRLKLRDPCTRAASALSAEAPRDQLSPNFNRGLCNVTD